MFFDTDRSRRDFLRFTAVTGATGVSASGWLGSFAKAAEANKPAGKVKRVVLLWAEGGPSHKDTLDLKPKSKGAGEFKQIATSAPDIQISEHFAKLAKYMHHGVVLRGMSTPEGAHARARYHLHTGYREGQGGLVYPSMGAYLAKEIGKADFSLPNFVAIGGRSYGAGFLGPKHQPLIVSDPSKGVEDLKAVVAGGQFEKRVGLLEEMEKAFYHEYSADAIHDHKTTYQRAVQMMNSKESKAFDLTSETSATRSAYGSGKFGEGCLMARRLLEVGIPFVEVSLGSWDTHQDNFERVKSLTGQVDSGISALVSDLKERGMLDSTLIIWMGEFGRTPNINARGAKPGRDHYAKAWSLLMLGGGLKGGMVYGKTDEEGAQVVEGKTSCTDFLATVCKLTGVDPNKENETPSKRPIRIVEKGANPIDAIIA